jgi:hypothetical protein
MLEPNIIKYQVEFQMTTKPEDIDDTECRKILLQSYDSKTTTHAALIIALMIGALTLISRWDAFFKNGWLLKLFFYVIISIIAYLSTYIVGRTLFWGNLSHTILWLNRTCRRDGSDDKEFNMYIGILEKTKPEIRERPGIFQFHQVAMQVAKSTVKTTEVPSEAELRLLELPFTRWLYYLFLYESRDFNIKLTVVSIPVLALFFTSEIMGFYGLPILLIWLLCLSGLGCAGLYALCFLVHKHDQIILHRQQTLHPKP